MASRSFFQRNWGRLSMKIELKALMRPTDYTIDRYISQELSKLTDCNAPEIASRFSQGSYWISNFILNSQFGCPIGPDARKFCLAFLRRAEATFFNYELARQALLEYVKLLEDGARKNSLYFRALHFFEVCLAMQWQAINLFARLSKEKVFQKGDGSDEEKLNKIYNTSKHYDPASLPDHLLHAVWITNEGINIEGVCLTFEQLETLIMELGKTADYVSACSFYDKATPPKVNAVEN
jgi:hypothetical protein